MIVHHGESAIQVFILHLYTKFEVRRPFRSEDMTHFSILCRPGDLDLWPWNCCALFLVGWKTFLPILVFLCRFVLDLSANSCHTRHVPGDFDLWPWRSRHLSVMRVFVLHLSTKFEVRRPSLSKDIGNLLCEHQSAWWPWPLTFWPLNRFTGYGYSCDGLPSRQIWASSVMLRHGTDRWTERHRSHSIMPPSLQGGGMKWQDITRYRQH